MVQKPMLSVKLAWLFLFHIFWQPFCEKCYKLLVQVNMNHFKWEKKKKKTVDETAVANT